MSPGWPRNLNFPNRPVRTRMPLGACFLAYFLNFSLYDVKDVESDRRAQIRTLAGAFRQSTFLAAQIGASLIAVGAMFLFLPRSLAGVCLFHAAASAWLCRHPFDGAMCGIVDTGYGAIVGLGTLLVISNS